jgi:hypothetical protein
MQGRAYTDLPLQAMLMAVWRRKPKAKVYALRANKSETSDSLKFTLKGAGERFDGHARTSAHALAFLA